MALISMGIHLGTCTESTNLWPIRHSGSLLFSSQFFKHVEGQYYEKFYHLAVMLFINWIFSRLIGKLSHYLFLRNSAGTTLQCVWDIVCVLRNNSAHVLVTALKMLLVVFLSLRPEQLGALSGLYPEWSPGLCSRSFSPCESLSRLGRAPRLLHSRSHIPVSARVLLMGRIRNSSCFTDLVYKLLYSGLKSPDFKFHSHKFVGTHDWLMGFSPAFFQLASPSFLWLEIFGILQSKENI